MNGDHVMITEGYGTQLAFMSGPVTIERQDKNFHTVIMDTIGRMFVTNEVGKYVIELCDGMRTLDQIVYVVGDRYAGIPLERVHKEVTRFLAAVTEIGVVTWLSVPQVAH
jgi:Coenzyme PQQ synthesis protein D (PqqD)